MHNISENIFKEGSFSENHIVLDVSDLPSGIFLVNIYFDRERISKRIIIEN